jgi:hypothetical protein
MASDSYANPRDFRNQKLRLECGASIEWKIGAVSMNFLTFFPTLDPCDGKNEWEDANLR